MDKRVLDPCCGGRMFYFDRASSSRNPRPLGRGGRQRSFARQRVRHSHAAHRAGRNVQAGQLRPAAPCSCRPEKLACRQVREAGAGPKSWLAAKYGKLGPDWREDIRQGFAEFFRVLAPDGVLVFKWNETQVKVSEVLALTDEQPIFGQVSGRGHMTHWLVFMKGPMQPPKGKDQK